MKDATKSTLQAKVFDFALTDMVCRHRESFQPLWTLESWVKFLIWMALSCGLSGDQENLEIFTEALGHRLASRMRRNFFERTLPNLEIRILADPAESNVLVFSLDEKTTLGTDKVAEALRQIHLEEWVVLDQRRWQFLDSLIAIPWQSSDE